MGECCGKGEGGEVSLWGKGVLHSHHGTGDVTFVGIGMDDFVVLVFVGMGEGVVTVVRLVGIGWRCVRVIWVDLVLCDAARTMVLFGLCALSVSL